MRNTIMLLAFSILCSNTGNAQAPKKGVTGPHVLIYKTKKNYNDKVAVILSDDKSKIVSYPDPSDLRIMGDKAVPTALHKGYLLDNRGGIGMNTAFLKMTNKEYGNLSHVPTTDELYSMIIDKDPLVILCDCGRKYDYKNPVDEINEIIDSRKLTTTCKVMKQSPSSRLGKKAKKQ